MWELKMRDIGLVDTLGIAELVSFKANSLRSRYRCILVDEVQDFGNLELGIIRRLAAHDSNDLFLCGDAAQAVSTKFQPMRDVGIDVSPKRSRRLQLNYRNSRDVLEAAYCVLQQNLSEALLDKEDLQVLDPEFSDTTGATPLLLGAQSLSEELTAARELVRLKLIESPEVKACIAVAGYTNFELTSFSRAISMTLLDGAISLDSGGAFVADLANTKGFEFDVVIVVNCADGILPDRAAPPEERFRELATLYVAMTRAKTDLILSWNGTVSPFLAGSESKFLAAPWAEYIPNLATLTPVEVPKHIDASRLGEDRQSWRDMNGEQFLYTDAAIGLSPELIARLRTLVKGSGLRRGRRSVEWATMGRAADAYIADPFTRNLWGPVGGPQFRSLIARLSHS